MFKSVSNLLTFQKTNVESGITPELIKQIIEEVENDPYAGLGAISKKAILVDKLYAAWTMHSCLIRKVPVKQSRPIVTELAVEESPPPSNVSVHRPPAKKTEVVKEISTTALIAASGQAQTSLV